MNMRRIMTFDWGDKTRFEKEYDGNLLLDATQYITYHRTVTEGSGDPRLEHAYDVVMAFINGVRLARAGTIDLALPWRWDGDMRCVVCGATPSHIAQRSTNAGATVRTVLVCKTHADGWTEGCDWPCPEPMPLKEETDDDS